MKITKIVLAMVLLLLSLSITTTAVGETIIQSFNSKTTLTPGWVVALDSDDKSTVIRSPADQPERIYGVVVDPNSAPLAVQKQGKQVFVATSGNYPVITSTENGPIKAGDYITISASDGVASKADQEDLYVLGRALEGFSGGNNTILYGNDKSAIGFMKAQLSTGRNPLLKDSAAVPSPLRTIGESIAGKSVPPLRIYGALAIFLVSGLIAAIMLLGAIKNGFVAIGRNPLSRGLVMKGLLRVTLAASAVLFIGLLGVYLLLKI